MKTTTRQQRLRWQRPPAIARHIRLWAERNPARTQVPLTASLGSARRLAGGLSQPSTRLIRMCSTSRSRSRTGLPGGAESGP